MIYQCTYRTSGSDSHVRAEFKTLSDAGLSSPTAAYKNLQEEKKWFYLELDE